MTIWQHKARVSRLLWVTIPLLLLLVVAARSPVGTPAALFSPTRVGGASGYGNERDIDFYSAIAYDATTDRYLTVWMTARNAASTSARFDVYGVFLDKAGEPSTEEFRISDSNAAAPNSAAAVVAGNGQFVVAWTVVGSPCKIHYQRVTDTSPIADRELTSGATHHHSQSLVYNAARGRYVLAFVEGDDYLPPTLFGASMADCGNNVSSIGRTKVMEFHFDDDNLVASPPTIVSELQGGAFRPRLAYSDSMDQYLIVWEDRRNAAGQLYLFDVYAQRLLGDMVLLGDNIHLAGPIEYENYDTSATWTPRPVVAGGDSRFLVAWFTRDEESAAVVWGVRGALVSAGGDVATPFDLAEIPFAASHVGESPTGFLSAVHAAHLQEYMIGLTSHLESLWGYFSVALVQRVDADGRLLELDGSPQSAVGIGRSIDYENNDQIYPSMAVSPGNGTDQIDILTTYSKHPSNAPPKDFDIWAARVQVPIEITPTPTPTYDPYPGPAPVHVPLLLKVRASQPPTATPTLEPYPGPGTRTPTPRPSLTPDPQIDALDGLGNLYSYDGKTSLGLVSSDCNAPDSIVNASGPYGSAASDTSIANPQGPYGSSDSPTSAFNDQSPKPPIIWTWGSDTWSFVAFVSTNSAKAPRIDPNRLLTYLRAKGGCP